MMTYRMQHGGYIYQLTAAVTSPRGPADLEPEKLKPG